MTAYRAWLDARGVGNRIVFARYDHAYDENQPSHLALARVSVNDLLALIDTNEAQIEDAGANLLSYTAPGDDHLVFDNDSFYTETLNGEALIDWVTRLVEGQPVDDVHCTDCSTAGCQASGI
jgi:hypothetical protein